jgi:cobalt-zinc-cadmium efflux system outer membrane protein
MSRAVLLLPVAVVSACASVSRTAGFSEAGQVVQERTGHRIHWDQGAPEDREVRERIDALSRTKLPLDAAVELALLNNRSLQVIYEDLGVAQADLVQAGLLRNPRLGLALQFPTSNTHPIGVQTSIVEDFVALFTIPLRTRLAGALLEEASWRVADAALRVAHDVKVSFVEMQTATQLVDLWESMFEAQEAATDLATRQRAAGNISDFELAQQQDALGSLRLALAASQAQVVDSREKLARLLGLYGPRAQVELAERLPEMPADEPPLEHLEDVAIGRRSDLAAATKRVDAAAQAAALVRGTRYLPSVGAGVSGGRDTEGVTSLGPSIDLELPIFDQGQANVRRVESDLRRAQARREELALDARSEVRSARNRHLTARAAVDYYRTSMIPLRERLVAQAQLQYNAMQIGLYQLLQAKQAQIAAYRDYIDVLRSYWVSRFDLELSVGGSLSAPPPLVPSAR